MKNHLFMAVAAASILLTTAALAATSSSSGTHPRRAGDRFTVVTDNEQLMCKVAGSEDSGPWLSPPGWTSAIAHYRQEGDIRCPRGVTNGM